jgi:hypothetical protein
MTIWCDRTIHPILIVEINVCMACRPDRRRVPILGEIQAGVLRTINAEPIAASTPVSMGGNIAQPLAA